MNGSIMTMTRLAKTEDIARDASLPLTIDGKPLLICHTADKFFVVANRCSHADEPMDCGRVRRGWLGCPVHGARFDLATGAALNPPAILPLKTYPAQVVDGWVEADLT